jgi:hypothetical protein
MKYIITEEQLKSLSEQKIPRSLRRRLTEDNLRKHVERAIEDEGEDFCEIYDDGFEFADEVISNAVESFLQDEENVSDLDFNIDNEIDYMLKDVIKEMFSEEIFDRYVEVCGNEWMS